MLKLFVIFLYFLFIPIRDLFAGCPLISGEYLCTQENFQPHQIEIIALIPQQFNSPFFYYKISDTLFAPAGFLSQIHTSNSNQSMESGVSDLLEEEEFCTDRNSLVIPHPLFRDKLIEYIPTLTGILAISYQKEESPFRDLHHQKTWNVVGTNECELSRPYFMEIPQKTFHRAVVADVSRLEKEIDSYFSAGAFEDEQAEEVFQATSHDAAADAAASSLEEPNYLQLFLAKKKTVETLTAVQSRILKSAFEANPYPSQDERVELAYEAGLSIKQINTYFVNRRARSKAKAKVAQKAQEPAKTFKAKAARRTRPNLFKKHSTFPKYVVQLLNRYYYEEHLTKPSQNEKQKIRDEINGLVMDPPFVIALEQVSTWFANKRKRTKAPRE